VKKQKKKLLKGAAAQLIVPKEKTITFRKPKNRIKSLEKRIVIAPNITIVYVRMT